jgi:hypothetical protein
MKKYVLASILGLILGLGSIYVSIYSSLKIAGTANFYLSILVFILSEIIIFVVGFSLTKKFITAPINRKGDIVKTYSLFYIVPAAILLLTGFRGISF